MRLRVSVEVWCTTFATALGLLPGCGGQSFATNGVASGGSSNTGGVANTGGGGSGGGLTTGGASSCPNPQRFVIAGADTGFVNCDNGLRHRPRVETCVSKLPRAAACASPDPGIASECSQDSECGASANGYCARGGGGQIPGCFCQYGCVSDSDCAAGSICVCGEPVGQCVPSTCKDNSACGANSLCATYQTCFAQGYACQTPQDACVVDADCGGDYCGLGQSGSRECQSRIQCPVIGRPFLIQGMERLAPLVRSRDWQASGPLPDVRQLSPQARADLAEAWGKNALMEHASIAAFARFSLQLMALGAPPNLLEQSQCAMADETRHAQQCFALASAFSDSQLGPGALAISNALDDITPEQVLITTILEGCVGETVAALEAEEALLFTSDEAVHGVLTQIARDERQHAALAWQTVRWLLSEQPHLVPVAERVFASVCASGPALAPAEEDPTQLGYGVLGVTRRAELRKQVLAGVVLPCAEALLLKFGQEPVPFASPSAAGTASTAA